MKVLFVCFASIIHIIVGFLHSLVCALQVGAAQASHSTVNITDVGNYWEAVEVSRVTIRFPAIYVTA